jgi:tRNA 2-selenouridine synthase
LARTPLIDVRAPIEFSLGGLPHSINLPIMNDEERALIGTTYKKQGHDAAVKLGFEVVSGSVKTDRVTAWRTYLQANPNAVIYCFRGGLRSQITQQWLKESGIDVPLIVGGYKAARNYLLEKMTQFTDEHHFLLIAGATGSGKTRLLEKLKASSRLIDLEDLACHRGSAFGSMTKSQPTQINFENELALQMMKLAVNDNPHPILLEDESRLIGRVAIPKQLFEKMRSSHVIWVEEPVETRVERIYEDYILEPKPDKLELLDRYKKSVIAISKKLGGLRTQEIITLLTEAEQNYKQTGLLESNRKWIEKLLIYYYDPLYLSSIQKRLVKIDFSGSLIECENHLRTLYAFPKN